MNVSKSVVVSLDCHACCVLFCRIIKLQLAIARLRLHASERSICLSVCLSVAKMQKTRFSQKLSNSELWYLLTIGSRTWAFQRTHHGTSKIQDGGDPPSWILIPKCKIMQFSQKLSNLKLRSLLTTYIGSRTWAFRRTHYWIPTIQDG